MEILLFILGILIGVGATMFFAALHAKALASIIAKLKFAYINKDIDEPHKFEEFALKDADKIIKGYGGMGKLLRYDGSVF